MGFQDRAYYRDSNRPGGNPLMWLLTGSVPLFTVFGIRVRMHAMMILFIVMELLFAESSGGLGYKNTLTAMSMLFVSVLLHEFGHCFGARRMGGEADEILMWPLGGLASTSPPRRPWPSFVTTAAGPAVNLVICLVTGTALYLMSKSAGAIPWFPLVHGIKGYVPTNWTTYYIFWFFTVNYALLMFNMLLVFYPFDAGRMVQEALWWKYGYYKSMMFATAVGMVGAVVVAAVGLASHSLNLILLAAFGFYTCYRQRVELKAAGPWAFEEEAGEDYSASLWNDPASHATTRHKHLSKRSLKKAQRRAKQAELEQARIDAILAKVSAHGMHSLTWRERRALHKATERQRMLETSGPSRKLHW